MKPKVLFYLPQPFKNVRKPITIRLKKRKVFWSNLMQNYDKVKKERKRTVSSEKLRACQKDRSVQQMKLLV